MKTEISWWKEIRLTRKRTDRLYYRLADELASLIENSRIPAGTILPSTLQLSRLLGINRATVRNAYAELFQRHLIVKKSAFHYHIPKKTKPEKLEPFPCIGIILPYRFSALMERKDLVILPYMEGIIDTAMAHNLSTIMLELPDGNASRKEIETFNDNLSRKLVGLVHFGSRGRNPDQPLNAVLDNKNLAQVYLYGIPDNPNVGSVMCDEISAAEILVKRFHDFNHREVGMVLLFDSWDGVGSNTRLSQSSRIRCSVMRSVFEKAGLNCDDRFHCTGCSDLQKTRKKLKEKYLSGNLPTVYFCHNDQVAQWCIQGLNDLGLKVPEDVSVVGFDGFPGTNPRLTTFNMPGYAMGRCCVKQLLQYFKNGIHENDRISYLKPVFFQGETLTYAKI